MSIAVQTTANRAVPHGSDRYLTTADLAERYRTAESTIRYWRHAGIGPRGVKIGRKVLYRETECQRWEQEREAEQNASLGGSAA